MICLWIMCWFPLNFFWWTKGEKVWKWSEKHMETGYIECCMKLYTFHRGHFITSLHSVIMNLNRSLPAVLLIRISEIKWVLLGAVSRDTGDGIARNHFALPCSLFTPILHSPWKLDSAAVIWHVCKRLWCFWQMLIEKALKAWLHCNQKKITEV